MKKFQKVAKVRKTVKIKYSFSMLHQDGGLGDTKNGRILSRLDRILPIFS